MAPHLGPFDALIFDLDGTLWDSTETVAAAWTAVVQRMGQPGRTVTPADIAGVMGKPHRELCQVLLPDLAEPQQDAVALACYAEEERTLHARGGRLYPGVAAGMEALSKRYPLFIVSNCQQGYIETFLAWSALAPLVRDFECHGNTGADKAENLRRVVQRNGLRAAVYIGDTDSDRHAAAGAGLPFVHAGYGFGQLTAPAARVRSFGELVAWLLPDADGTNSPGAQGEMPA